MGDREAYVLAAKRTPVGKAGGRLRRVPPEVLAAVAVRAALEQAGVGGDRVDEVILGNAVGPGGNLARLALLEAGLPVHVPGLTVDRQCAAGLEAVRLAAALVRAGAGTCYVAGGVESTSQEPDRILPDGTRLRRARFAPDRLGDPDMGEAAEALARRYGISRADQDAWAAESRARARAAVRAGVFEAEIAPVPLPAGPDGVQWVAQDELPRRDLPLDRLAALPPAFVDGGTVTAGNACRHNDGAAALVIASEAVCRRAAEAGATGDGPRPLGRIVDAVAVGVRPDLPGAGAGAALRALAARTGVDLGHVDLFEISEPFAAVVLACMRELGLPPGKVNVWGGALALGHPYGATGAILLVRLLYGLRRLGGRYGAVAVASAGGLGAAMLVERV